MTHTIDASVLVVGAGPVWLTLAIDLAARPTGMWPGAGTRSRPSRWIWSTWCGVLATLD
jgi:hypothetical protein